MAFDLDDEELKATREMPCNKINYKLKKTVQEDKVEKMLRLINELFIKQARENESQKHRWFEIDYEDTQRLLTAIEELITEYKKTKADLYEANNCISDLLDIIKYKEKIIDKMLDTFIGLDSDIEIVRQHARINTKEKKAEVLKMYEIKCNDK